jgi:hypothetical protein
MEDRNMTTREAAEKAGVSIQRAQQFARTHDVKRVWNDKQSTNRFEWTEQNVKDLENRKGKYGPKYYG